MTTTDRPDSTERPGHHWREPERVQEYVTRMDANAGEREQQFALLARLLPYPAEDPIAVLDLGAGYGAVAAAVLSVYPNASATLLDISEAMMSVGAERMAPFAGRYRYLHGDFADGTLPEALRGPFHAIVSARAIHHLPADATRSLYAACAARLLPGGCLFNLDMVAAADEDAATVYRRAETRARQQRGAAPAATAAQSGHRHERFHPLGDHLAWLRQAGLVAVDCYAKWLGNALIGGFRPPLRG
ncbi:MAG TPA: class I SAM-dependent methyltransferase [Dehalococcoidia bacterium]|nr:class I SAM-dependent methyltransferase [Dehalococcoidia bacterium]